MSILFFNFLIHMIDPNAVADELKNLDQPAIQPAHLTTNTASEKDPFSFQPELIQPLFEMPEIIRKPESAKLEP